MPTIIYDEKTNTVTANEYEIGSSYGNEWSREPFFIITCTCGAPVVAYFKGEPPYKNMGAYGIDRGHYKLLTLPKAYKSRAWGIVLNGDNCPRYECDNSIYYAPSELAALEKMIRDQLYIRMADAMNRSKLAHLHQTIKDSADLQKVFQFRHNQFHAHPDAALIVDPKKQSATLKQLGICFDGKERWIDTSAPETCHTDLEANILAAHGEECTCSLCMK